MYYHSIKKSFNTEWTCLYLWALRRKSNRSNWKYLHNILLTWISGDNSCYSRFTFQEFVERYRFLVSGVGPSHKVTPPLSQSGRLQPILQIDCRVASARICDEILTNGDFQIGLTKVFLKDEQELFLEQQRDRALAEKILILQKNIKGIFISLFLLQGRPCSVF